VLCNFRKHYFQTTRRMLEPNWLDPYSSAASFDGWQGRRHGQRETTDGRQSFVEARGPCCKPRTWLVCTGWKKRGLIVPDWIPSVEMPRLLRRRSRRGRWRRHRRSRFHVA
jgi:hypothetical protein